jgi:hypothetical protein
MSSSDSIVPADQVPPAQQPGSTAEFTPTAESAPTWAPQPAQASKSPLFYPLLAGALALTAIGPIAAVAPGMLRPLMLWALFAAVLYLAHRATWRGAAGEKRKFSWQPLVPLMLPVIAVYVISAGAYIQFGRAWWAPLAVAAVVAALVLFAGPVVARLRTRA